MLRALSLAGLGIVLFPCEARAFPIVEDDIDKILAESGVEFRGFGFMWGVGGLGDVLRGDIRFWTDVIGQERGEEKMELKRRERRVPRGLSQPGSSCSSRPASASSPHLCHSSGPLY